MVRCDCAVCVVAITEAVFLRVRVRQLEHEVVRALRNLGGAQLVVLDGLHRLRC